MNHNQQLQKLQSKQLVTDYISWRLAKSGYHQWNIINRIDLNQNNKKRLFNTMRQISYAFETKYNEKYASLIDQLSLTTQANCKDVFLTIIIELFQVKTIFSTSQNCTGCTNVECSICDKAESKLFSKEHSKTETPLPPQQLNLAQLECNWGRIVGLFSFSGCLAIICYEKRMPGLVYDIINWLVQLLNEDDYRINYWIESQGHWVSLNMYVIFF